MRMAMFAPRERLFMEAIDAAVGNIKKQVKRPKPSPKDEGGIALAA
jgi:hypothetical protein